MVATSKTDGPFIRTQNQSPCNLPPMTPKSQHLPPRYLIRALCAPFFPPVPDVMTWWARRTKRKVKEKMAAKVKVVMRHDDDDDDGGRLTFLPNFQISVEGYKKETTTVLARNNGSGAYGEWKNRQWPNRGWVTSYRHICHSGDSCCQVFVFKTHACLRAVQLQMSRWWTEERPETSELEIGTARKSEDRRKDDSPTVVERSATGHCRSQCRLELFAGFVLFFVLFLTLPILFILCTHFGFFPVYFPPRIFHRFFPILFRP